MSDWHPSTVLRKERAADGLFHLVLDVHQSPLATEHRHAGQYVKLRLPGLGEGYFAIASAPGPREHFELLIKAGSPLADGLCALSPGQSVEVSQPSGKGFPLDKALGKNVLLFATGSGISAIRSAIEAIGERRGDFGHVTLFFGVRTPAAFAYQEELSRWEKLGIKVLRTVSQPGASGWQGLTGYVQAHLDQVEVQNAVALVVGQKAMVQGVTEALQARGLAAGEIFLNF